MVTDAGPPEADQRLALGLAAHEVDAPCPEPWGAVAHGAKW